MISGLPEYADSADKCARDEKKHNGGKRVRLNANSLTTNLLVTALVLVMVFLLPWIDRRICKRIGLNLEGGVSSNPNAEVLLKVRQGILAAVFGLYLLILAWIVFFSRSASATYHVHVALYEDLQNAIRIDFGLFGVIRSIFKDGIREALSHVEIVSLANVTQVYMNIMLFVPLGYLLPYISSWFRAKVHIRPAVACFIISLCIENLQLITRRGFYDMDDLVSNSIGGLIGQMLFISVAYVVTHPNWRKELESYRRWKKNARTRTLYPFARHMGLSRTTIFATNEEEIWDFYVMKLGFRLKKQIVPLDSEGTDLLLEMGRYQIEIHCSNHAELLKRQTLTLSAKRLKPIIRRLNMNGIETGQVEQDPYTGLQCIHFEGPDQTVITVIEK